MKHRCARRLLCGAFLSVVWSGVTLCSILSVARAQEAKPVPASKTAPMSLPANFQQPFSGKVQGMPFIEVARMLHQMAGLNVVADGEPVAQQASFDFKGTLQQALDQVADIFDFNWTVSKGGTVLMSKRFTNPAERPQTSLREIRQVTKDMIKALRTTTYEADYFQLPIMFQQMYQSLTPPQIQALHNAPLPAATLLPGQMDRLTQMISCATFAKDLDAWNHLSEQLATLPKAFLQTQQHGGDPLNAAASTYYDVMLTWQENTGSFGFKMFFSIPPELEVEAKSAFKTEERRP